MPTSKNTKIGLKWPSTNKFVTIPAILWSIFHLYTSYFGSLPAIQQRAIHLLFAMSLSFALSKRYSKTNWNILNNLLKIILIILTVMSTLYMYFGYHQIISRLGMPNVYDLVMGFVAVILVLEATRRQMGLVLPIISLIAIGYAFLGSYLNGYFAHGGVSIERFITQLYLSTEGIFGIPLGVSATYVILFIIFGAFLRNSGAGDFFIDLSYSLFGRVRGGPAKVSIMASSLFGTVSGAVLANITTTGSFTIPLMKKTGYSPTYAAAIENVASTGAQITPPIMGAAIFIMAETLGINYIEIVIAAIVPALLYYVALFIMSDLQAGKIGIKGLPSAKLPHLWKVISNGWFFFIPPIVLLYLLMGPQYSPALAGFYSILSIVLVSYFKKENRMGLKRILNSLEQGSIGTIEVAMATACAGITIGVISATGIGTKLSFILLDLAKGNLFLLLFLTMIASLILGMGVTTTAAYIIVSVLVAPSLIKAGIPPIAAHLFVFYFAPISNLTPPVALGAYAAAGISGADPMKTAFLSCRLGFVGLIIPFLFVYHPVLLLKGNTIDIIIAVVTAIFGIFSLSIVFENFLIKKLNWIEKLTFFVSGILLIIPNFYYSFYGFILLLIAFILHLNLFKKIKT